MPKNLSIVLPTYNDAPQLVRCLESIANQHTKPDYVIVVDNNSTDGTSEVLARYPFVTVVKEARQGIVYARDAGFNATNTDLIARIDADTILPTDWVTRLHRFYDGGNRENYALTGGGYFYNIRLPRLNGWAQSQLVFRLNRLLVGHYVLWGSNMVFRRAHWLQVKDKVCDRDDIHEDIDLSIHLHQAGVKIAYHGRLRVGAYLKRVFTRHDELRFHMSRWPQTLKVHHYKHWRGIIMLNLVLWFVARPVIFLTEDIARLAGKPPLH